MCLKLLPVFVHSMKIWTHNQSTSSWICGHQKSDVCRQVSSRPEDALNEKIVARPSVKLWGHPIDHPLLCSSIISTDGMENLKRHVAGNFCIFVLFAWVVSSVTRSYSSSPLSIDNVTFQLKIKITEGIVSYNEDEFAENYACIHH